MCARVHSTVTSHLKGSPTLSGALKIGLATAPENFTELQLGATVDIVTKYRQLLMQMFEPKPLAKRLIGQHFTPEAHNWKRWLKEAALLANDFGAVEDDPFAYNEAATVSLLTAAAAKVGLLALAEFASLKRGPGSKKASVKGRCDLWISSRRHSWAFEFKQIHYLGGFHKPETILGWLERACEDARKLTHHEADKRYGVLVISLFRAEEIAPDFLQSIGHAVTKADYAWQIQPCSEFATDTFILFKQVHKRRLPTAAKGRQASKTKRLTPRGSEKSSPSDG